MAQKAKEGCADKESRYCQSAAKKSAVRAEWLVTVLYEKNGFVALL